jgi:hypothetical protein
MQNPIFAVKENMRFAKNSFKALAYHAQTLESE